jgi:tartrate-resistant acid phosphatase type 5
VKFVRNLFAASQTFLGGRIFASNLSVDDQPRLSFAVIGDWGRQGSPSQRQVARQMGIACEREKPAFVVSVGDNFYERGVTSLDDSHWQHSFETVYDAPSLQVPWYVTLGNHDYAGLCEPQLEYGDTHSRWIIPARYYSQVHQVTPAMQLECFFLDTCPFVEEYQNNPELSDVSAQNPNAQLEWLDSSLSASKAEWKLVFGHHPTYSSGLAHGNQPEIIQYVLPILEKHHVQAYFAGHDHDLEHLKLDRLHLIVSGAGSEHRPVKSPTTSAFSRACSGFVMASVGENNMQMRFFDGEGHHLYSANVAHHPVG